MRKRNSQFASKRRKNKTKKNTMKSSPKVSMHKIINLLPQERSQLMNPQPLPERRVLQALFKVNKDKNEDAMGTPKKFVVATEGAVDSTEEAIEVVTKEEATRNHTEVARNGRTVLAHMLEETDSIPIKKMSKEAQP